MSQTSANQAYKAYKKTLENSGLPHAKAQLALLSALEAEDRVAAFKWFCANKLTQATVAEVRPQKPSKKAPTPKVVEVEEVEDLSKIGVQVFSIERARAKARPEPKHPKPASKKPATKQDKPRTWAGAFVQRQGLPTSVGEVFIWESKKHGTKSTHEVIGRTDDGGIVTKRNSITRKAA